MKKQKVNSLNPNEVMEFIEIRIRKKFPSISLLDGYQKWTGGEISESRLYAPTTENKQINKSINLGDTQIGLISVNPGSPSSPTMTLNISINIYTKEALDILNYLKRLVSGLTNVETLLQIQNIPSKRGPKSGFSEEEIIQIIDEWNRVKEYTKQEVFCIDHNIGSSTLRKWMNRYKR
jgi:hypothetical protein